jgi:hypothetical protein
MIADTFREIFWPTLWATLVGALVGVAGGVPVGLALDSLRRKREEATARKANGLASSTSCGSSRRAWTTM